MEYKDTAGLEGAAILKAFDEAGIGFRMDRPTVLAAFKNGDQRSVTIGDDGKPYAKYDGEIQPLSVALHRFAHDNRELVDGRTLPREDQGKGRPGMASKQDFADVKAKSEWIAEHGIEAYEALPLKTPVTSEVRYREDFYSLPTAEKVKRIRETPGLVESLPNRPKVPFAELEANIQKAKTRHQLELDRMQMEQLRNG